MAQTIRSRIEAAAKKLRQHQQDHLMKFVDQLSQDEKLELLGDVEELDLDFLDTLIEKYVLGEPETKLPGSLEPVPIYRTQPESGQEKKYQQGRELGERLIAEHKVAAFTVAGGMGTRLRFDGPKGCMPATQLRNKTLFQVFAEGILATQRRYNCVVPWYIMTSPANHDRTVEYFEEKDYYGLDAANVKFFRQGVMPCFDRDGKMLLAQRHRLASSPDGHGGSLRALHVSGALEDMNRRGVQYISYFQVDNPLVQVIDPLFIGLHAQDRAEMSSKAVVKCEPLEKVGNFVLADGRVSVIEYSDLPEEQALKRRDDGELVFQWGSIAIHIISRGFVEKINSKGFSLPWHRAIKSVGYLDDAGNLITPEKPNAVKLETFVFDALGLAERSIVLEIERAEQFAPIKNFSGVDSLQSSQELQVARDAAWMEQAGITVPRKDDGTPDVILEISPLFALDVEELIRKRAQLRPLKAGDMVYLG